MEDPKNDPVRYLADDPSGGTDTFVLRISDTTLSDHEDRIGRGRLGAAGGPVAMEATSAWIHLLPHELLLLIFELSIDADTPIRTLVTLTNVCKLWQHIVEGTPNFWRYISGKEALPHVRKALAMAEDVPLEISYPKIGAKTDQDIFLAEISGRAAQWGSLVVNLRSGDPVVAVLESTVAPRLKTLHLYGSYRWREGPVTLFRGQQAPLSLTRLTVHYVPVVLEPLRLSGLRSLELRELPIISAEEILRVLSVSPALEHCSLQRLACLKNFALPGHKQEFLALQGLENTTIQLPRLGFLTLGGLPVSFVHLVLSTIRAPNLRRCLFDCKIDRHDQTPTSELLTTHISHLIPAFKALTSGAQEMEIASFGDNEWTFEVGEFVIGAEGDALQRRHLDDTLEWLFGCLGGHLKALPVSLVFFELDINSEWFTWVASTPKVTKLELWTDAFSERDPDRQPQNIISLLAQPLESAPTRWLFPELESIDTNVVHAYGKSKILEMVKARHSFIEAQRKGTGDSVLKSFREIRLRGGRNNISREIAPNAEFLNTIQEAAKGAEIWWEDVKWTGNEDSSSRMSSEGMDNS